MTLYIDFANEFLNVDKSFKFIKGFGGGKLLSLVQDMLFLISQNSLTKVEDARITETSLLFCADPPPPSGTPFGSMPLLMLWTPGKKSLPKFSATGPFLSE